MTLTDWSGIKTSVNQDTNQKLKKKKSIFHVSCLRKLWVNMVQWIDSKEREKQGICEAEEPIQKRNEGKF